MTAEQLSSRIPAIQLCYVRLAVTQPQVAAADIARWAIGDLKATPVVIVP